MTITIIETENTTLVRGDTFTGLTVPGAGTEHRIKNFKISWAEKLYAMQILTFHRGTPIPNTRKRLANYLVAEVIYTADGVILRSGGVDEDGYGHTFRDAYIDFLTSIYDRYNSLKKRKKSISGQERLVLRSLHRLLK